MSTDAPSSLTPAAFVQPRPVLRWLGVCLAAAGWIVSEQLFLTSVGADSPLVEALCRGGDGAADSCRSVLRSRWAYVGAADSLLRVPVAALGMGYFAFIGLWYLLIGTPTRGRAWWHVVPLLAVVTAAWVSIDLLRAMFGALQEVCVGCVITHGVNFALAALTIAAWPWRDPRPAAPPHPTPRLGVAALIGCSVVLAGHLMFAVAGRLLAALHEHRTAFTRIVDDPEYVRWNYERQPVVDIPPRGDGTAIGNADAPNSAVLFVDFQCAACKTAYEVADAVVRAHPDLLRVEYRHFPQDSACNDNPRLAAGGHTVACKAAAAAEAVLRVGGPDAYHEMRRRMYLSQRDLDSVTFATLAVAAGVKSAADFDTAWYSAEVRDRVRDDVKLGESVGVESVPAVFLNGRRLEGWKKPETWDALLGITPTASAPATQAVPRP